VNFYKDDMLPLLLQSLKISCALSLDTWASKWLTELPQFSTGGENYTVLLGDILKIGKG
jgi:hypothetical protein